MPIIPGSDNNIENLNEAKKVSEKIGYPVIIKSTNGGGGRGIKIVKNENELKKNLELAKKEAEQSFGNNEVYIEKYIQNPRHIEIQIIGDKFGNIIHLGERECSIQRRNQKIVEECPSPVMTENERKKFAILTVEAMNKIKYFNLGTVEYLYKDGNFYFIEMNTRLQVEHTITEQVYNIDIVKEQINTSSGKKISVKQNDIKNGHSIEFRINAENPITLLPSTGIVKTYHPPGGPGIRIDSSLYNGCNISSFYDGLISKIISTGNDRMECIMRLKRALNEYVIEGVQTNIPILKKILDNNQFINGNFHINWIDKL